MCAQNFSLVRDDYVRIVTSIRSGRINFVVGWPLGEFMDANIHEDPLFSGNGLNTFYKFIATTGESERARKFRDICIASDTNVMRRHH